jgi:hypothetical protein
LLFYLPNSSTSAPASSSGTDLSFGEVARVRRRQNDERATPSPHPPLPCSKPETAASASKQLGESRHARNVKPGQFQSQQKSTSTEQFASSVVFLSATFPFSSRFSRRDRPT